MLKVPSPVYLAHSAIRPGLAILPGPGFPTPGKPGLGNIAFLAKVGNNGQ